MTGPYYDKPKGPIMILEIAREPISRQLAFGGGYNRNAVRLILSEVQRERGPAAVAGSSTERIWPPPSVSSRAPVFPK